LFSHGPLGRWGAFVWLAVRWSEPRPFHQFSSAHGDHGRRAILCLRRPWSPAH